MARAEVMQHKDVRIVHIDLSNATLSQIKEAITEAAPLIQNQPQSSVLCWVNTEGTVMDMEIFDVLKMFTLKNKPLIKMTAISGIGGVQEVVVPSIIMFTKRDNLVIKNSREDALDFLASFAAQVSIDK